jgi:hypothetical protein
MHITSNTVRKGALLVLLARAGAAPTTTVSAAANAGATSADVFPPAGSKFVGVAEKVEADVLTV